MKSTRIREFRECHYFSQYYAPLSNNNLDDECQLFRCVAVADRRKTFLINFLGRAITLPEKSSNPYEISKNMICSCQFTFVRITPPNTEKILLNHRSFSTS